VASRPQVSASSSTPLGSVCKWPVRTSSSRSKGDPGHADRAAELCGVTEKTIRSWINDGLPTMREGKPGRGAVKTIVDLAEVLRWYLEQDALDAAKTRLASRRPTSTKWRTHYAAASSRT
jgi:hypothetical protein